MLVNCFCHRLTSDQEMVVPNAASVEGIAVDWISNILYYTQNLQQGQLTAVSLTSSNFTDKRVLISGLGNPRSIVVYPSKGWEKCTDTCILSFECCSVLYLLVSSSFFNQDFVAVQSLGQSFTFFYLFNFFIYVPHDANGSAHFVVYSECQFKLQLSNHRQSCSDFLPLIQK